MDNKFPIGVSDGRYTTDGLDNLAKAKRLKGSYFGIYSADDLLMRTPRGHNLSEELAHAYIEGQKQAGNPVLTADKLIVKIPGGHSTPFTHGAFLGVWEHLIHIGFATRDIYT